MCIGGRAPGDVFRGSEDVLQFLEHLVRILGEYSDDPVLLGSLVHNGIEILSLAISTETALIPTSSMTLMVSSLYAMLMMHLVLGSCFITVRRT